MTRGGVQHLTAEECLAHIAPRYALAQRSLEALHRRYRAMEERMERMRIQQKVMKQETRQAQTVTGRLDRLELQFARMQASGR